MIEPRILFDHQRVELIIKRFALGLAEHHTKLDQLALIGMQPRGVELSRRIYQELVRITAKTDIKYGELDITFFRDDIGRSDEIFLPKETRIDFSTENLNIVLIDDVLYTGRSIRAGIDALMSYGRPAAVELMVLIDRRFQRELPISPDYVGATVDSRTTGEYVKVDWKDANNKVWLLSKS